MGTRGLLVHETDFVVQYRIDTALHILDLGILRRRHSVRMPLRAEITLLSFLFVVSAFCVARFCLCDTTFTFKIVNAEEDQSLWCMTRASSRPAVSRANSNVIPTLPSKGSLAKAYVTSADSLCAVISRRPSQAPSRDEGFDESPSNSHESLQEIEPELAIRFQVRNLDSVKYSS